MDRSLEHEIGSGMASTIQLLGSTMTCGQALCKSVELGLSSDNGQNSWKKVIEFVGIAKSLALVGGHIYPFTSTLTSGVGLNA